MSPTENDLRAALRDGEGDGIDPDRIIFRVRQQRAALRTKIVNVAATVLVVAGLGGGGWLLARVGGGDEEAKSASNGAARGAAGGGAALSVLPSGNSGNFGAAGGASAPSAAAGSAARTCPSSLPRYPQPAPAASGALFTGPVATALVCTYGNAATPNVKPSGTVLTGADAAALVDSLEQSKTAKPHVMCPDYRTADEQTIAVIGFKADGSPAGTVTTVLGRPSCAVEVSSSKGVRFGWSPPQRVLLKLAQLHPQPNRSVGAGEPSSSPTK